MRGTVQLYGGSFSGMNIVTKDYSDMINEGVYVTDLLAPTGPIAIPTVPFRRIFTSRRSRM